VEGKTIRANLEGSIYQRKSDGYYVAAISLPNGKRKYFYGKTEADALEKKRQAERQQDDGANLASEDPTLKRFMETWLDVVQQSLRPKTYESYLSLSRNHIIPELGKTKLSKLTAQEVQVFINSRTRKGLSPRSVQYIRAVLRMALSQAQKWGMLQKNVAKLVEVPRIPRKHAFETSQADVQAILKAVEGHRLETLFLTSVSLGLRLGEVLALKWSDVDFPARTLSVSRSLQKIKGDKYRFVEQKTIRSTRKLPVPERLFASIDAHRTRQTLEQTVFPQTPWGLIFCTRNGTPLSGPDVTHAFQRLLAAQGVPRIRIHDLRHACISLLLAQGVDVRTVAEIAGHSQVSMTLNVYAHAIPGQSKIALDKLDALFQADETEKT
jgi:integrase